MLFNSFNFIFVFLPALLLLYFFLINKLCLNKYSKELIILFSIFFYGYFKYEYIFLLLFSICFNYFIANKIFLSKSKIYLSFGILINLSLLIYFKYTFFLLENINRLLGTSLSLNFQIILPLAISFYTFQQLAFLIDAYDSKIEKPKSFKNYLFFVIFFPQLIAGPIVRYQAINRQIELFGKKLSLENFIIGFCIFIVGLFKKNCLADNLGLIADQSFDHTLSINQLNILDQWIGLIAYAFQIYFDFSGYSDMAIGLAFIFGIKLPLNFDSPYKSKSLAEFWQRWHITLSQFIRDYLFLRLYKILNKINLNYILVFCVLVSFSLSGLWHGSSWNFLLWGLIHGSFLLIEKFFLKKILFYKKYLSRISTLLIILLAWVSFRAENIFSLKTYYKSLFFINSDFKNQSILNLGFKEIFIFFLSFFVIFFLKNSKEYFKEKTGIFILDINIKSAFYIAVLIIFIIFFGSHSADPFIYFQF